ncbi:hypothetical protein JCM11641_006460 [Rhodosporidiobolus odoratus]
MDAEGRVYHLGVKRGDLSPHILTVGDPTRLRRFSSFLDPDSITFDSTSSRGFTVVTGTYRRKGVSLVAIGMGVSSMDFLVREARAVIDGPIAIIRFGSCGSLSPSILPVGSIGVPKRAIQISTNYDYLPASFSAQGDSNEEGGKAYTESRPFEADGELQDANTVGKTGTKVVDLEGHASADCFYSTQGRLDPAFLDNNETLIPDLLEKVPECKSLEMETAHLFYLSSIAAPLSSSADSSHVPSIRAAACHMTFAARSVPPSSSSHTSTSTSALAAAPPPPPVDAASAVGQATQHEVKGEEGGDEQAVFIDPDTVERLEREVGKGVLDALVGFEL